MERGDPEDRAVLRAWGEVIRRYRHWQGLSRRELAQRAGLSPVFLGEIERGEKDPSAHSLRLVAAALNAPLPELYLRVAACLDATSKRSNSGEQTALPLEMRESKDAYLDGVSAAKDETAFDLYKLVRFLPADQQVSFLVLAKSLLDSQRASE